MSVRSPISPKELKLGLRNRLKLLGLRTHGNSSVAPLISDYLKTYFPKEWLLSIFPDLANKLHGEVMPQVDNMLQFTASTSSAVSYVLVYSALFDSVEEAISALKGTTPNYRIKRTMHHKRKPNVNFLSDYVLAKGAHHLMPSQNVVDQSVISAYLDNIGLPDLTEDETSSKLSAVFSFFLNQNSLSESAEIGGLSIEDLEYIVRRIGCHIQPILKKIADNVRA